MPWQLIYTSAPRGLVSGQSGFCTVARSADLREALAQRLEQLSYYHYLRVADAATASKNPTVCAFRLLDLRGTKYHVLTRIQPCGLDFTARTNHLAHHLVFQSGELAQLPSPAAILRFWGGWLSSWQGEPRLLEDPPLNSFNAAAKFCLPAQTWLQVTGDAGRAAGLLESECVRGCYLICPPGSEGQVLAMYCETLQLLNPNGQYALRPWRHCFTNFLQAEDNPADFPWRACQEGTPAHQQAVQRTTGLLPLRSVRVPTNSLIKLAREGVKPPASTPTAAAAPALAASQTTLTLQRQTRDKKEPGLVWTDTGHWRKPADGLEERGSREINISVPLLRVGIFVVVLLVLFAVKFWFHKPPPPPQAIASRPPPVQSGPATVNPGNENAPATHPGRYPSPPPRAIAPDEAQLARLSGDEPTYVFTTPNLLDFNLPINSIGRFARLIEQFDLATPPADVHTSLDVNSWDFPATATPLAIHRQGQVLSAGAEGGPECSFDYANWIVNSNDPVAVHASFDTEPRAFSIQFGYSPSNHMDPFRLLIVNQKNPPEPLRFSRQWLRPDCKGLVASLRDPLGRRLQGQFNLLGTLAWQLRPFVKTARDPQAHYLYNNWPAEVAPPPGDELDFSELKERLAAAQGRMNTAIAKIERELTGQIQEAELDKPLGKWVAPTNEELLSFYTFATRLSLTRPKFIEYLNRLRDIQGGKWPPLSRDDDEPALQAKFQSIYAWWSTQHHEAVGDSNYFAGVWNSLGDIEKKVSAEQRDQNEIDNLQKRLEAVPATLDEVAYVGLFIIDPPWPAKLEMIRFEGP